MRVRHLVVGPLQTNCWLVGADASLIVIDPGGDPDRVLERIGSARVRWIVLTHGHFDHLAAAGEVLAAAGGSLAVHIADAPWITSAAGTGAELFGFDDHAPPADREVRDGDAIEAGDVHLEVLHTPGHTPGGICLLGEGHLFAGDTLFAGSVGRTDFPRGDGAVLRESIGTKLAPLPDETVVHPGHGPDTTIGRERVINPFFPRA